MNVSHSLFSKYSASQLGPDEGRFMSAFPISPVLSTSHARNTKIASHAVLSSELTGFTTYRTIMQSYRVLLRSRPLADGTGSKRSHGTQKFSRRARVSSATFREAAALEATRLLYLAFHSSSKEST